MSDKVIWKGSTQLSPVPVVMVTCQRPGRPPNIITIAWTGIVCSAPPMLSISVRPERHSYPILVDTREFVVNLPTVAQTQATDYCGVASGKDVDKFAKTGLTAAPASQVAPPLIAECPLNLECQVRQVLALGSHTLFLAEIVAVQAAAELIDAEGRLALENAGLIAYAHGHYYALGHQLGHFGFAVRKKDTARGKALNPK